VVDLEQKGFQLLVEDDVEPKHLEAHIARVVVGLAALVIVCERLLHAEEGLDDHRVDLLLDGLPGLAHFVEVFLEPVEVAFAASAILQVAGVVLHEVLVELVDGVVGEVHEEVVHIRVRGLLLGVRAESQEAVPVQENAQGVHRSDQHLEPDVEFEALDQLGPHDLLLTDPFLFLPAVHLLPLADQLDALALAAGFRLEDEEAFFVLLLVALHVVFKVLELVGHELGAGEVALDLAAEHLAHLDEVLGELVLAGEQLHAGEVVDLVLVLEQAELVWCEVGVEPD